jgi:hypothetical protein
MNEIKDSCESAWQWVTKEAVLTEENMRGFLFFFKIKKFLTFLFF